MATKPTPWYKYPYVNDYGGTEPYSPPYGSPGYYPKPDINIWCPDGIAITALLPGTISGINSSDGHVPAWGAVMTIRLDKPVNAVATHIAYLHLEPIESHFQVGQHISKGDVIGRSGGQTAQGSEKVPVGVALCDGDIYGETGFRDQYAGSAWLDPAPVLAAAGNKGTGATQTATEAITSIASHIRPDESVAELLSGMDIALQILNPFPPANTDAAVSGIVPLNADGSCPVGYHRVTAPSGKALCYIDSAGQQPTGVSFTGLFGLIAGVKDPFTYIGDVTEGLMQNFAAVFIRTLFIVFGVIVLVVILQATFTTAVNKALEPVGGISGAVKTVAAIA